jgi:thioredoxin-related protein
MTRFSLFLLAAASFAADAYKPVHEYDPKRDAAKDIQAAVDEANRTGRRVLLEVGGTWCSWCRTLDRYFADRPELTDLRDQNFVMVKINWSPENKNEAVLSRYPKIKGYPHIFVLDRDGKLLHSQDTGELEDGKSYSLEKMTAFLNRWKR